MSTKFKQISQDSRKEMHRKLVAKADKIKEEIQALYYEEVENPENQEEKIKVKLDRKLNASEEKSLEHLNLRQNQIQMSLRLAHNTGWIDEWRQEHIKVLEKEVAAHFEKLEQIPVPVLLEDQEEDVEVEAIKKNLENKIDIAEQKILALKRAAKCKKCYQRGFIGINISTSEFSLCSCTQKTIHLYRLKTD